MTQEHDIKREIEEKLAIEYEGKAFEHIWLCKIGDQWHIHKDYYAVIKGEVFSLFRTDKVLSDDSIFTTVKDCVCIGDYDPNKWYQRVQRSYEHTTFKVLTNIENP